MILSPIKRLCFLLPTLIAASPQASNPTSSSPTSLPVPLQRAVPACAQPCLQTSLFEQFPLACTVPVNLGCLCSRYTINGESLGEVALGCIYASCPTVDSQAASAYNVCLGQKDAVTPTQTALTITARPSTRTSTTASSTSLLTTKYTTTPPPSSQARPSASNSIIVDSISFIPSATSSAHPSMSTTAAAAAATSTNPKTMSPAQIAGLAVAAAASFVIAIGLMALSIFLRRKREQKRMIVTEEKRAYDPFSTNHSNRFSHYSPESPSPTVPLMQFPLPPRITHPPNAANLGPASTSTPYPNRSLEPNKLNMTLYKAPSVSKNPELDATDLSQIHPLLRPQARFRDSQSSSTLNDQIGLAISAELPGTSGGIPRAPPPTHQAGPKRVRAKSLRRSLDSSVRPDSVLTQDTVFEEDDLLARRRSSKLLPTPPMPIPPIRSLRVSKKPPAIGGPVNRGLPHRQIPQQPELFLDIPIRHERLQPERMRSTKGPLPSPARLPPSLAPPVEFTFLRDASSSTITNFSEPSNASDIPDYYFSAHSPKQSPKRSPPIVGVGPKEAPKVVDIKPKKSSSTISRSTSKASTNVRDSVSSQTSFESADPDDSTPEDEDEDKQLSDENKLSPVAESPISNLRYPKVPRASNQLVPRSPRSPRSPQSQRGEGSPRLPGSPSALLMKRRGEKATLNLGNRTIMDSPLKSEAVDHMNGHRQHLRSNSVESWMPGPALSASDYSRSSRVQSIQWAKSPAMYDPAVVQPLDVRSRRQQQQQQRHQSSDINTLKSPLWVPRLTPRREGDDLFLSVTYSKPTNSQLLPP